MEEEKQKTIKKNNLTVKDGPAKELMRISTIGLLFIIFDLLFFPIPEPNKEIAVTLLSVYTTGWVSIIGYWIGSSIGSDKKNNLLSK